MFRIKSIYINIYIKKGKKRKKETIIRSFKKKKDNTNYVCIYYFVCIRFNIEHETFLPEKIVHSNFELIILRPHSCVTIGLFI